METFSALVQGIHSSPVNSPHKGQWRGALMYSLIWAWTNGLVNNRNAGELRRHRAHYDVTVMMNSCLSNVEGNELDFQKLMLVTNETMAVTWKHIFSHKTIISFVAYKALYSCTWHS